MSFASMTEEERPRLLFHIGVHRTGTTSIQTLLHKNRGRLSEMGFLYPQIGREWHQNAAAWAIISGRSSPEEMAKRLKDRAAELKCGTVIISGEDFARIEDLEPLRVLKDYFDVKITCYLRAQDAWLESWYNQNVKWPWDATLASAGVDEFWDKRRTFYWLDYAKLLDRWSAVFGIENMLVSVYEREVIVPSLEEHFCRHCEIPFEGLIGPKREQNASVPVAALEFLRRMQLLELNETQRSIIVQQVVHAYEHTRHSDSQHIFSPERRRTIMEEFAQSNADVARRYFGKEDGDLFRRQVPDDRSWAPPVLEDADELLRLRVAPIIRNLAARIAHLKREHDREKKRLGETVAQLERISKK